MRREHDFSILVPSRPTNARDETTEFCTKYGNISEEKIDPLDP
jgi:hypothetical protein